MSATSGQYGKIMIGSSNLVECMGWTLNRSTQTHSYASCSTTGGDGRKYKKRVTGPRDATGTIKGLQDPSDPIENYISDGSSATLKLYWTASKFYTVPAVIENLRVEVDIDTGAPVPWEADFGADGEITNT